MRCVTWSRDSHGLFDYESRYIAKRNIKTYTGGKIIRLNNDVEFINKALTAQDHDPTAKPLLVVNEKNGKFFVENDTLINLSQQMESENEKIQDEDVNNKMFIVVRNLKSTQAKNDYCLKKGDIVKLGRIKFKVKDFRTEIAAANLDANNRRASCSPVKGTNKNGQTIIQDDEYWVGGDDFSEEAIEIDCGVVDATQSEIQCKVCWSNEQSPQNPLLNSCKCDGSVRYIHYECLKHWLKQKMQKKEDQNIISYSWKQFECEICKKPYPYVFKSNGRKYRLVDVDVPEDRTFLWLESLTFEKNSSRMVHLVMPDKDKNSFKLGRGHESDVRVSDISVSRCHAILKYEGDHQFYLEDNLSKFGTLVLAKSAIELNSDQTVAVQIGRSVISFCVKPIQIEQQQLKTPSPIRQNQQVRGTVEDVLRQKIEETNQRINRLMNSALLSNGPSDNDNNNLEHYLQQSQTEDNRHIDPTSSLVLQSSVQQSSSKRDTELFENQLNQQERLALNNTLHYFEKRILSVEQRLAERDSNFKSLLVNGTGGAQQVLSQSPPRASRAGNQATEEEMLRSISDYQKQISQNERKYRQLQNQVQYSEFEGQSSISADKQQLAHLKHKYGRIGASDNKLEDLKEESFEDFVIQNENFDNDDDDEDQPLRIKSVEQENNHRNDSSYINHFSQLSSKDHTQDGMNRNSNTMLPTKQNTQYGGQWVNGAYIVENNLFSQIENQSQQDDCSKLYFRAQTPEKMEFMHAHQSSNKIPQNTASGQIKRSKTSYNGQQPSRYYQQQQQSPEKRQHHQMKYEQYGKANTTKQRDANPLSSQSPWRMLSEDYDSTSQQSHPTQGLRTFKVEQQTQIQRNNGQCVTISSSTQERYNQSPIKRNSNMSNNQQMTSTPNKISKTQDTSIGRTIAASSSYAQNSANRRRKTTVPSSNSSNPSQTLYSRQMDKPHMRF